MNFSMFLLYFLLVQPSHPGVVLKTINCPCPCPTGLAIHGKSLWVVDRFTDRIYEIQVNSGKVINEIPAPCHQPFGLAFDGKGKLWVGSDLPESKPDNLYRVDPVTGTVLDAIPAPVDYIRSLAFIGDALVVGTRRDVVALVDPGDGSILRKLPGISGEADGLAFDGRYLWSADKKRDRIYSVDPGRGEVIFYLPCPGPAVSGLAAEKGILYVLDYEKRKIFEVATTGKSAYWTHSPRRLNLCFRVIAHNQGDNPATVTMWIAVPENDERQTILSGLGWDPKPESFEKDRWGTGFAKFVFKDLEPGKTAEARMTAEVELKTLVRCIYPEDVGPLDSVPVEIRKKYLADGRKYQLKDDFLKRLARKTIGNERNPWWIARKLARAVGERISYELSGGWEPAPVVLKRGSGSCSEYTFAFIALCRLAGLPARYVGAEVVRGEDGSFDETFHRWAQVYLPPYGWVDWDVQAADSKLGAKFAENICTRANRYLVTTRGGGPSRILGWDYNSAVKFTTRGKARVLVERYAEWSPMRGNH